MTRHSGLVAYKIVVIAVIGFLFFIAMSAFMCQLFFFFFENYHLKFAVPHFSPTLFPAAADE